ncbi:conserved repeat domain-containing protein [Pseudoxanthomonas sp. CF385]|nr:conserved repeat domain-containing protein [Pseudoxanthomonas sp. CF385]
MHWQARNMARLRAALLAVLAMIALSWGLPSRAQSGCTTGACVSAGPRLVSIDSTQGPVLNLLFQALLPGTTVNLSVLDWNALAGSDINLNALIVRLGANLGISDTSQVLNTDITLAQLRLAMVQVLQADGQTLAANALNILPLNAAGLTGSIRLSQLLRIDLPPGALTSVRLDLLDLVTGSAQLYNFRNVLTTPTPITLNTAALGLSGVANVQAWLQVVEPPVYACGGQGTSFHTGAIRLKLNLDVVQGLNLQAVINALNAAGLGLVNLSLTADVLKLQVYADVARAEGTITAVDYVAGAVGFQARPGLVNLYVGTVSDSLFFNRSRVLTPADVTPVTINNLDLRFNVGLLGIGLINVRVPLQLTARAAATGSPALQNFSVNVPFPQTRTASSGTVSAGNLVTSLLGNLDLHVVSGSPEVTLLGLIILAPDALTPLLNSVLNLVETTLRGVSNAVLQPVFNLLLRDLTDNLLGLLGIRIGNAVFTVEGVARSCAATLTLAKVLQPAADPGRFTLAITQGATPVASANNVGNGGATAPAVTTPGLSYTLGETAGTGTQLDRYTTAWACVDQDGTAVSSGTGTSFSLTAPAAGANAVAITCSVTNTRALRSDVSIAKTDSAANYTPGATGTYVITVSNAGPDAASGVAVTDTLPPGMRLSGAWTCVASGGGSCPAGGGAAGDSTVSLSVNVDAAGSATITLPVVYSADPAAY